MTKHQITVPTSLNDIPLATFHEYMNLPETMDDTEKALNTISILCGIGMSEISKIPYTTLKKIISLLMETVNETPKFQPTFVLNGVKYGFIPNIDEISTGEFIDIESYQKEINDTYKLMSVLFRRITIEGQQGRYEIEPYTGKINDDFKFMPSGVAYGAKVFFWTLGTDLGSYILKYLEVEKNNNPQLFTDLEKNGDGIPSFTSFATEILPEWMSLQHTPFIKHSYGLPSNPIWQTWKNNYYKKDEQ